MTTPLPYKAHPWHGVPTGPRVPDLINAYIEIVPTDTVKYEIDKDTGHLRLDRPQKYSSQCPALYGFIPQTYCGTHIGARCSEVVKRPGIIGDGDPLDICVLTEHTLAHGDLIVRAVPIGGFRMIDGGTADDKIVAVLYEDAAFGSWRTLSDAPKAVIERLRHYFLTYKELPGSSTRKVEIAEIYGAEEAKNVISISVRDYKENQFIDEK